MSYELKLCPFCGDKPRIDQHDYRGDFRSLHHIVECTGCDAFMDVDGEHLNAIKAWNTRVVELIAPLKELEGTHPVVLYFGTDEDREGFIEVCKEAMPNAVAVKL